MNWINIEEDLPIDEDLVCVKTERGETTVCRFRNDSFGLGDQDFSVVEWRSIQHPDQVCQMQRPQSIAQAWDHKGADFSRLRQHLAQ